MGALDECREKCRAVKFVAEKVEWDEKANHVGSLIATSQLLDANHTSIPGLFFKGVYTSQPVSGDVYSFALMDTFGRDRRRVFMLEVYPPHVVSHRSKAGEVKGPHLHLGDSSLDCAVVRPVRGQLAGISVAFWIERFRRHTRIRDHGQHCLTHPLSGTLFG
jgi:hypothetical protein